MSMPNPDHIRSQLSQELDTLEQADRAGQQGQSTVELDQQAVGRLSRMDALQNQAMSVANARMRDVRRQRIKAALSRLDRGEFGYCLDCGEEIPASRLAADPTIPKCLDCARD